MQYVPWMTAYQIQRIIYKRSILHIKAYSLEVSRMSGYKFFYSNRCSHIDLVFYIYKKMVSNYILSFVVIILTDELVLYLDYGKVKFYLRFCRGGG